MRVPSVVGIVLAGGGFLTLVTVSCVGSDADPPASAAADAGSTDGASSGDGGNNGCGAAEVCGNKVDDNCNGVVDEGCDCDGVREGTTRACGQAGPGTCTAGTQTCKEGVWSACTGVLPRDFEEACDGKDENCNGQVDEGLKITCVHDADHDGYGLATDKKEVCPDPSDAGTGGCPVDYILESASLGNDCNDADSAVKPGAAEVCDAVDSDCDDKPRNGCPSITETYGNLTMSTLLGYSTQVAGCGTQVYQSSVTACSAGGATGLDGFYGGVQFSGPTQIRLFCNDGVISETAAAPEYSYSLVLNGPSTTAQLTGPGRGDDTPGAAACDDGQWLVGIKLTNSCLFDRMTIICAPITFTKTGATWKAQTGVTSTKYVLGNPSSGHPEKTYQCPSGSVLTQITEWHTTGSATDSNYISGIQIGCKPIGYVPQ